MSVRVGERSAALDTLLGGWRCRHAAFIAAGNPCSRRKPDGWNARRMRALAGWLRRTAFAEGQGRARGWAEPHMLVGLPPGRAAVLARRFDQAAIVLVARGRPTRLLWLLS